MAARKESEFAHDNERSGDRMLIHFHFHFSNCAYYMSCYDDKFNFAPLSLIAGNLSAWRYLLMVRIKFYEVT